MSYTKKQFLEDVAKEARALKKLATPEELAKLDINRFNGTKSELCIYGLICGDCFTARAVDLVELCAPLLLESNEAGEPIMIVAETRNKCSRWSPIEAYAYENNDASNLISFLKGERKDLVL